MAWLLLAPLGWAASPVVTKVEPPDWVVEPDGITLRLLVTGSDLAGARVGAQFATSRVLISQNGTHLFCDVAIPANAAPGSYPIHITTGSGSADAPFSVVSALAPQGRFQGFSPDDVIYLLMPDRFASGDASHATTNRSQAHAWHGGDFAGIIQHLPYIKQLGITAIWMTPIYQNANRDYHGYGAVDFYGVEKHFGTLDTFRELVDKAHALGIKVIQDEVANHTGPDNPWVKDPPTPTWFNGTPAHHLDESWRTWTLIDPHATREMQRSTLEGWFANKLPDLNQNDAECARYLIQNTLWWIGRTGLDGIREDTLPYVPRSFWHDWTGEIVKHYPAVNVVGEVFDGDPGLVSFFQGEREEWGVDTGVGSLFDFPLHYAIRKFFTGAIPATDLAKVIAHDSLYRDANRLVTFVDLHDIPRFMSLPGASMDGLKNVFTFLFTERGIPMIYYGDEIGMQGGEDPDNRRDFPGGWKGDPHNAFERAGRTPEQESLVAHVERLGKIRAELAPLRRGSMVELFAGKDQYAFARTTESDSVVVIVNRSAQAADLRIPLEGSRVEDGATLADVLGAAPAATARQGALAVRMPANYVAIYRRQ
jgi:glycosidase